MSLRALQDYVFTAKYARWRADLRRRETYAESVERVFRMHERRYGPALAAELAEAKAAVLERLVLGSQRALQFAGEPIEDRNARLYNCTVSYCDRPRFFQEALWLLLCGCGVGFSVQIHQVARLPDIAPPTGPPLTFQAEDSIEGWADALGALLSSYLAGDRPVAGVDGRPVAFDLARIRPAGARLRGSGVAPGPEPLRLALERVRALIDRRLAAGERRLRPIDCYDIVMHASDAVLSGGVRRSASLCIFSPDDAEMAAAKTGPWFTSDPQRGRSNNSALLLRDVTSREDFARLMGHVRGYGEPGFIWADSTEIVYNPCCEIGMFPVDEETGASGWSFCNLCEINCKACVDRDTLLKAARAAAILGTIQAGYTSFPYLGPVSERIVRREALLGVSMTGMMDNPAIAFDVALQREAAAEILAVNAEVAPKVGVGLAARTTCVKPAGTTSLILGTASGIHPHHARRYLRRVQANRREAPARYLAAHQSEAVSPSVWNPNGTDVVLDFTVEVGDEARVRTEMPAAELLRLVRLTQANWVAAGRRPERCVRPWLTHNVSNTITVRDGEWAEVEEILYAHRGDFSGVSLLPWGGDLDYPQAPYVAVLSEEELAERWGQRVARAEALAAEAVVFFGDLWLACAAVLDGANVAARPGAEAWVAAVHDWAKRVFAGDRREAVHCLKRVWIRSRWQVLVASERPVDYTGMVEVVDATGRVDLDPACAGGACEL